MVSQMTNSLARSVEPFVERVFPDRQFFRIGYRTAQTDDVLSAIDVPVSILEEEIASGLELITTVSATGEVSSKIVGSLGLILLGPRSNTSIEDLVSQAVCKESLRLEEVSVSELFDLLRKLETAIIEVKAAIAQVSSEAWT